MAFPFGILVSLPHLSLVPSLLQKLRLAYARLWLAVLAGEREAIVQRTTELGMDGAQARGTEAAAAAAVRGGRPRARLCARPDPAPPPAVQWRFVALMLALAPGAASGLGGGGLLEGDGGASLVAGLTNEQRAAAAARVVRMTGGVAAHSAFFESIPRDLLLVLKTNNLLRFVNDALGAPVNRFRIVGEYAQRGLDAAGAAAGGVPLRRPSRLARLRLRLNEALLPLLLRLARWAWPLAGAPE